MKGSMLIKFSLFIAVMVCSACAKIKPDEIGVRTINFGTKGVVAQDYAPGYYRNLWPIESWHRFPRTVQRMQFIQDVSQPYVRTESAITVTSSDGDRVLMSVEVFYRIADNQGHRVVQDTGLGDRYKQLVRDLSIETTRSVFGQMNTEDFYDPSEREKMREQARHYLAERLTPRGFELINFLVVALVFEPEYENLIKQKKIADQIVSLEQSKKLAAQERGRVAMIRQETEVYLRSIQQQTESKITQMNAETDLAIASITTRARKYAIQLGADADLYLKQKESESTTLLKNAEAEGTLRLNQALTGPGSSNLTALEAARNLQLHDVVFPSIGFDWFNPNQMARHLGAEPISSASEVQSTSESTQNAGH